MSSIVTGTVAVLAEIALIGGIFVMKIDAERPEQTPYVSISGVVVEEGFLDNWQGYRLTLESCVEGATLRPCGLGDESSVRRSFLYAPESYSRHLSGRVSLGDIRAYSVHPLSVQFRDEYWLDVEAHQR